MRFSTIDTVKLGFFFQKINSNLEFKLFDPDRPMVKIIFRSDLIETLHDELSMASDGMNTKRQIKRPIAGQKSFFDAIQVISDRCYRNISRK